MLHSRITTGADAPRTLAGEFALRAFLSEQYEALGHAAALLAGRRGERLIAAIRDALNQPGRLTRRVQRLLLELRAILFLDHPQEEPFDDFFSVAILDPEDPVVHELCLLADGLDDALRNAGIAPGLHAHST